MTRFFSLAATAAYLAAIGLIGVAAMALWLHLAACESGVCS